MSIIGALADFFRPKTPTAHSAPHIAPAPGGKNSTLTDLRKMADSLVSSIPQTVTNLANISQNSNDQYLSQSSSQFAMPNLSGMAHNIGQPSWGSFQQAFLALNANVQAFDQNYANMVNGDGWAAYPNSNQTDNINALHQVGAQLAIMASQISVSAAQLAQQIANGQRGGAPSVRAPGGAATRPLSPAAQKVARRMILGELAQRLGPRRVYEVLGEDMWDMLPED